MLILAIYPTINSLVALPSLLSVQDLGHDLAIISEEIETSDKIINQSLQCIIRDPPKEYVSTEAQTGDISSAEYVDSGVGTNGDLFVTMGNEGTETDSECHTNYAKLSSC